MRTQLVVDGRLYGFARSPRYVNPIPSQLDSCDRFADALETLARR